MDINWGFGEKLPISSSYCGGKISSVAVRVSDVVNLGINASKIPTVCELYFLPSSSTVGGYSNVAVVSRNVVTSCDGFYEDFL